ncbi:MAG: hypothetical protein GEV07_25350 [Streptosporangiales bacterium]|nr:hypothetical protein [Streptosporangiales bacterium]
MTTCAREPPACSRPWRSPPARSSPRPTAHTAPSSSASSWPRSTPRSPPSSTCTWCWTTHKAPTVKNWLLAHPRFQLHFTPTYSSWLNIVERWFAEITRRMIRRGTYRSVTELETALRAWIEDWNTNRDRSSGPRPPTRASTPSPPIFTELTTQHTTSSMSNAIWSIAASMPP